MSYRYNDVIIIYLTASGLSPGVILKGCRAADVCSVAYMMSQLIFVARSKSP
jgi:hypothetical protein